jgi:hypothetical protein
MLQMKDNAVYKGQVANGQRHGHGVMEYHNGRRFEGEWKNGKREGQGYEEYPNGNVYEG